MGHWVFMGHCCGCFWATVVGVFGSLSVSSLRVPLCVRVCVTLALCMCHSACISVCVFCHNVFGSARMCFWEGVCMSAWLCVCVCVLPVTVCTCMCVRARACVCVGGGGGGGVICFLDL
jgi:hypothetical protein